MGEKIKLSQETIASLRKANDTYPLNTVDYDERFLFNLMKAVFSKNDLIKCGQTSKINHLDRDKIKFVKGLFSARVDKNTTRFNQFKEHAVNIGLFIAEKATN